ncbi:MAG: DUF305 domain-containing protein, partial [Mycetocola sp.]
MSTTPGHSGGGDTVAGGTDAADTNTGIADATDDAERSIDGDDVDGADLVGTTVRRPRRRGRGVLIGVVLIVALVAAVLAFSAGRLSAIGTTTPTTTSAEAGFSRDMQTHHNQGVQMAMIIRDLTDDPATRTLAYDIATAQATQSGIMSGWLSVWGLPQYSSEPDMTWMTRPGLDGTGHDHTGKAEAAHVPGEPMPGLATEEQLDELQSQSGVEAERTFLTLMIAHHRGAIEMAEALLDRSENPVVTTFATGVVTAQQSEIDLMQYMLEER